MMTDHAGMHVPEATAIHISALWTRHRNPLCGAVFWPLVDLFRSGNEVDIAAKKLCPRCRERAHTIDKPIAQMSCGLLAS